jgi:tRNA(Ile)-lysidine synthase
LSGQTGDIVESIYAGLGPGFPKKLGVALSGGSDSTAVMVALAQGRTAHDSEICAATVDHGLRPEAAQEARLARDCAQRFGVPHEILKWGDWDGRGNLQDKARTARYALLADWAVRRGLGAVVLGHTADDQAETVLMRLGRSAGVDGLSGMAARRIVHNVTFLRPALGLRRAALRDFLTENGTGWTDDPSNDNTRFDRVRVRGLLPDLEGAGITVEALADTAENMRDARAALDWFTFTSARDHAQVIGGAVAIDKRAFRTFPTEIARRLMIGALRWVGGGTYPPRRDALGRLIAQARRSDAASTLGGCTVFGAGGRIWVAREMEAVSDICASGDGAWDGRWQITGRNPGDAAELRVLGAAGLEQFPDWRDHGVPRGVLLSLPALWMGDHVLAVPLLRDDKDTRIDRIGGADDFFATLLSH